MARRSVSNSDLLLTQLQAPRAPAGQVVRPRLTRLLRAAKGQPLVLVIAPAGFGKTTLLSQWAQLSRTPVAWLSLDETSNDPARFWRCLIAALRIHFPRLGQVALSHLQTWSAQSNQAILAALLDDLAVVDGAFALVLDDYDRVANAATHAAVANLVEHLPDRARLFVAARAEPPWPALPRWRAEGRVFQLAPGELAFAPEEAAAFFRKARLRLGPGDAARLAQRTEGWIAALQLAALSLRAKPDVEQFLPTFDGRHRHVFDYLTGEVLSHQVVDAQLFLLRTSILDRLSAPVCNALLDRRDSQTMLETLAARGLFLFSLDESRQWYRYHQLFADFLRGKLRREAPELELALHDRASRWFETNGLLDEAIAHGLAAGESERMASLVESAVARVLWLNGEHLILEGWLRALPEPILLNHPRLLVCDAWLQIWNNRLEQAEKRLDQAERASAGSVALCAPPGEIASARAGLARAHGAAQDTVAQARVALRLLDESEWVQRGLLQANLGDAQRLLGDVLGAQAAFREAYALLKRAGSLHLMLHVLGNLMQMQVQQGDLVAAAATDRRAAAVVARRSESQPTAGIVDIARGGLLYERNQLGAAEQAFAAGLALCREWPGLVEARLEGHLGLFHLALARGEWEQAASALEQAEAEARPYDVATWHARLGRERTELWLRQGRLTEAVAWLAGWPMVDLAESSPPTLARELPALLLAARLWLAQGKLDACLDVLGRLSQAAAAGGLTRGQVQALLLEAQALWRAGQNAAAGSRMGQALCVAQPQQYVRVFLEDEAVSGPLLSLVPRQAATAAYLERLRVAQRQAAAALAAPGLTRREIEVLKLVARGLTNDEIARDLTVAAGTVRRHLENIYTKLDARTRTRSVARARELGFLP